MTYPGMTKQVTAVLTVDVFTNQSQTYKLGGCPILSLPTKVHVNGLKMLKDGDHSFDGNNLNFTAQQIGENPVIQVEYWAVA